MPDLPPVYTNQSGLRWVVNEHLPEIADYVEQLIRDAELGRGYGEERKRRKDAEQEVERLREVMIDASHRLGRLKSFSD